MEKAALVFKVVRLVILIGAVGAIGYALFLVFDKIGPGIFAGVLSGYIVYEGVRASKKYGERRH